MTHPLHQEALIAVREFKESEAKILEILQKIDSQKIYRQMGYASLFDYSVKGLGLTESVAYGFIAVARKAVQVPELQVAIEKGDLSVSQAKRVTVALTKSNAEDLIQKAKTLNQRELQKEVARINPKAATHDVAKYVTETRIEVRFGASEEFMKKLKRVQDLVSQKNRSSANFEVALEKAMDVFLEKNDPVRKAERALAREAERGVSLKASETIGQIVVEPSSQIIGEPLSQIIEAPASRSVVNPTSEMAGMTQEHQKPYSRKALPARTKHLIFQRDKGGCTQSLNNGKQSKGVKCGETRWTEIHHVQPIELGGDDSLENLTTLCSNHHKAIHEEIEGYV